MSIIVPVHNAAAWLPDCLQSVCAQTFSQRLELSVYDDASTDASVAVVASWGDRLTARGVTCVVSAGVVGDGPRGVGFARNAAVRQSRGWFLCFLDADDTMDARRVAIQHQVAAAAATTDPVLVGCRFRRLPAESTARYTRWANTLSPAQLRTQAYTAHGPTVAMPTWFCARSTFDRVGGGGFSEAGSGFPEDLDFFYRHLDAGGRLARADDHLVTYRYHVTSATFSVTADVIYRLRLDALRSAVLSKWPRFTIWSAGKAGKRFYRALAVHERVRVRAFCDVDARKIARGCYTHEQSEKRERVPIVHFSEATPPFVLCVKQDLTGGGFEENLASLNLAEGTDYVHFG